MLFDYTTLKKLRLSQPRKTTQKEVADVLGIEQSTYTKKERGQLPTSLKQLEALARHYKVDLSVFFQFSGTEDILGRGSHTGAKGGKPEMHDRLKHLRQYVPKAIEYMEAAEQAAQHDIVDLIEFLLSQAIQSIQDALPFLRGAAKSAESNNLKNATNNATM